MAEERVFRSGFVTLLGRPNVGKSSLINRIVGEKVSIVSQIPQTTRTSIRCIANFSDAQIVFVDTPGLHNPKHALGEFMMDRAREALEEVDCVCLVLDAIRPDAGEEEAMLHEVLRDVRTPLIIAVNKTDKVPLDAEALEALAAPWKDREPVAVVPVSAQTGDNVDRLVELLVAQLPEGEPHYPEDMMLDGTERFLAAEIIREKVFSLARDEVPHSVAVVVEEFKSPDEYPERENLFVQAVIYVEREGQKGILIGQGGSFLKRIGTLARLEMEKAWGFPVFLQLWVKVRKEWRRSPADLRRFGYRS